MFIDNRTQTLKNSIERFVRNSDEVLICSPFINDTDVLFSLLQQRNLKLTLICRLSFPATPELFEEILPLLNRNKRVFIYDDSSLHSKIYLFRRNKRSLAALIGSSNFTYSGIAENKEMNVVVTKQLKYIEGYFGYLIENRYDELTEDVIQYYRSFYRSPTRQIRFRGLRVNQALVDEYHESQERYFRLKGILDSRNGTGLPFTYVFDSFVHYFKKDIVPEYELTQFQNFSRRNLIRFFDIFLRDYFGEDERNWRISHLNFCQNIRGNYLTLPAATIRNFFLRLHSVTSGSGNGVRQEVIGNVNARLLRDLLAFIIDEQLDMGQKYAVALTDRNRGGRRIDQLGPSALEKYRDGSYLTNIQL